MTPVEWRGEEIRARHHGECVTISRRHFLLGGAATAAALAAEGLLIEPQRVTVTRHPLGTPGAGVVLRMAQLSDLHLRAIGRHQHRIASAVRRLRPDLLLFTGDAIDRAQRLDVLARFLDLLGASVPGFAILGNWEHWARVDLDALRRAYAARRIRLLVNETAHHAHRGRRVLVTGLDDATGGMPNLETALRGAQPAANHLLLAHSPGYRDRLPAGSRPTQAAGLPAFGGADLSRYRFACMLAGHTHGGQIALFGWAPVRPRGSGRYVSGWYRDGGVPLYVSRGLGTSVLPVRLGAPPEIAVFEWYLAERG